jgi:hypothetical protein
MGRWKPLPVFETAGEAQPPGEDSGIERSQQAAPQL